MKLVVLTALALLSVPAFAYKDGTYSCKNSVNTENTYRIETVVVGGNSVPFVEATMRSRQNYADPNSPIVESVLRGFGTVATAGTSSTVLVAALRLEFEGDQLQHCRQ